MRVPTSTHLMIVAAALAAPIMPAAAQEAVTDQANRVAEQAEVLAQETNQLTNTMAEQARQEGDAVQVRGDDRVERTDDDDDSGNWGLLGLLGLAGLLGLRRRKDHHDRHVHRDGERNRDTRL